MFLKWAMRKSGHVIQHLLPELRERAHTVMLVISAHAVKCWRLPHYQMVAHRDRIGLPEAAKDLAVWLLPVRFPFRQNVQVLHFAVGVSGLVVLIQPIAEGVTPGGQFEELIGIGWKYPVVVGCQRPVFEDVYIFLPRPIGASVRHQLIGKAARYGCAFIFAAVVAQKKAVNAQLLPAR